MTDRPPRPWAVLDTNAVLDWLLFDDPGARHVGTAISLGTLGWVATAAMRDEYFDVVGRPRWAFSATDLARHTAVWAARCTLVAAPATRPDGLRVPRCADPDDQMFVDLAVSARPEWLLSRDKAVLAVAPCLRLLGTCVATPAGWTAERSAGWATVS